MPLYRTLYWCRPDTHPEGAYMKRLLGVLLVVAGMDRPSQVMASRQIKSRHLS